MGLHVFPIPIPPPPSLSTQAFLFKRFFSIMVYPWVRGKGKGLSMGSQESDMTQRLNHHQYLLSLCLSTQSLFLMKVKSRQLYSVLHSAPLLFTAQN